MTRTVARGVPDPRAPRPRLAAAARHIPLGLICTLWLIPVAALFVSSLRPARDAADSGWWTVLRHGGVTLENYRQVLAAQGIGTSLLNSLAITLPATLIPLLVAAPAAYAFAWMPFPGRDGLFAGLVGLLVVPLQMTFIPVLRLLTAFKLTGTFAALWLAHTAYGLPLALYLLHNFVAALPRDMLEAAEADGAGPPAVFLRIVVPLAAPAFAALAIFQFLWVWNDLLVALVYLGGQPDVAPLTVTISNLVNSLGGGWHLLTAAAFVSMVLPLVLFFGLQRSFVRGIVAGAVKG